MDRRSPELSASLGPPYQCVTTSPGYTSCAGSSEILNFAYMLLSWGGEYLGSHTPASLEALVSNLRTWAAANAPAVDPSVTTPVSTIMTDVATSLLMLWPTLRADPAMAPGDRQLIDDWIINRLVALPGTTPFITFPNDLGEWAAEIAMADSIRRSDNANFAYAIQRFYGSLLQMRTDGSFPLSARLSACSAVYSNADLIHLTAIAEMAATQGYDLYHLTVDGKSLETGIQFFLNAYQNPDLLYQYSKAGLGGCFEGKSGDPPDFAAVSNNLLDNFAWTEAYLARFPFSANAARIRQIVGSNIAAAPFPIMATRAGLNTTCAFRKPYEFQPVNGANVTIASGDGQIVGPDQPQPAPLSVRVTDNSGKPLAGVLVSFAVTQGSARLSTSAQVLTDASGNASATVSVTSGPVAVRATALAASAQFFLPVTGPAIFSGGIEGIGASVPAVAPVSPGALFSIYGQNFVPAGTGRRVSGGELVNGALPQSLLGVCVSVGGQSAPVLDVFPGQINAVAPLLPPLTTVDVVVTTGCGTALAVQTAAEPVTVAAAAPEFLHFGASADGQNPVAAIDSVTGSIVGPTNAGSGYAPAHPGDLGTIFASGFGPTNPAISPGMTSAGPAPIKDPSVIVMLGPVTLDPKDVLYAGAAPGLLISQLNIRIPQGVPTGKQPILIRIGSLASPQGGYLAIAAP